jgi:transketolase
MPEARQNRNIMFGVREFAMTSICTGLSLHSILKPFASTFFVFADYMKPAIRMAAIMKVPVTYIMTHDSVFVGEDGPTHEPIEQLAMIRAIPNVVTIRPADEKEVIGAYEHALNSKDHPTMIVLTRQNIKSLKNTRTDISKGAYLIRKSKNDKTIVASGSELALALELGDLHDLNVVSMVSTELFDKQSDKYFNSVIKNFDRTITMEAASTFG